MADRYPLIANSQTKRIEELASGDNLNLQGNSIVGATTITSQTFVGDLVGIASSSLALIDGANILSGTISSQRLSGYYPIQVEFANSVDADGIVNGTIPRDVLDGTYDIDITGTAQTANFLNNAANINSGIVNVNRLSGTYNINITGVANSTINLAPGTYDINITGIASTATNLANAANITTGTISPDRLSGTYGINITGSANTLTDAANITTGTINPDRLFGTYGINITGTAVTSINVIGGIASVTNLSVSGLTTISGSTSTDLVRITQTGSGNALRVEDSTNPDFTSFIVDNDGQVGIKTNQPNYDLDIRGTTLFGGPIYLEGGELTSRVGILSGTDRNLISGIDTTGIEVSDLVDDVGGTLINPGTVVVSVGINSITITPQHNRFGTPIIATLNIIREFYAGLDGEVLVSRGSGLPPNWSSASNTSIQNISTTTTYYPTFVKDSGFQPIGIAKSELVFIPEPGNLGIGSTNPKERLDVGGNINVSGNINVDNTATVGFLTASNVYVSGISTVGFLTATNVSVAETITSNTVDALTYFGNGETLSGIVTQITAGIGINIDPPSGKGVVQIDSYKPTGKTIYVNQNGNDNNTGLSENHAKRTIKGASKVAVFGDTIKVYPGVYVEENPIILKKTVSVEGTELRNCVVTPRYPYLDLFHVNNGCHITDMSFIGPDMTDGAAVVALQTLEGVAVDRYFDAARMIRLNLDYIANEAVGFLTSTQYIGAGRAQVSDPVFQVVNSSGITTDTVNCSDDIKSILKCIIHDITRGGNSKCVEAGKSYYDDNNTLLHITGTDPNGYSVKQATIDTIKYAADITRAIVNNVTWGGNPVGLGTTVINASYNELTGITTITANNHGLVKDDAVKIVGLGFTCPSGPGIVTYPTGAFGYIFNVQSIVDNNNFEVVVGQSTLPHTYVSGGTIQKYTSFSHDFYQVKDLGMQKDPLTGFNNAVNGCANVVSAIYSCVGIVTNIIGFGSTAFSSVGIKTSYPGNSGIGFTSTLGITSAIYDEVTGKTIIIAPGLKVQEGEAIELRDLKFSCSSGGGISTQSFPSGRYGYDFFVDTINDDGSFEVYVGPSTLPHTYVGNGVIVDRTVAVTTATYDNLTGITTIHANGLSIETGDLVRIRGLEFSCPSGSGTTTIYPTGNNGFDFKVLDIVVDKPIAVSTAIYDNSTGITTITAPGIAVTYNGLVELRNLRFTCPPGSGITTDLYPTGNNGYEFRVLSAIGSTFTVNVGPSTIPHTYDSGGVAIDRTLTANDTFTINVGPSTIPHTYVGSGIVIPPFSRGVGPITQGPYVRNCTNFIPKSIGMKIDGFAAEPGDQDDIGVTGTMSVDSYTQYNQGGIGVSITNGAYAQLVSIFTICDDIAIFTGAGGQCDITNSNSSFGRLGLVSKGVGDAETKSIYRYTGIAATTANAEQSIITVSGIGNYRPYDGQAIYFGELFYTVQRVEIIDGGSGYSSPPTVVFDDPPENVNGIRAEAIATIQNGSVVSVDLISTGTQYRTPPKITFVGGGGNGAKAKSIMSPIYYTIESATLPSSGISTITLNTNLNNTVSTETTVYFTRLSLQITSSHSFEWVGSGNDINKAKPSLGGVVIQENEVVKIDGGEVVYTSTDQAGNFRIGDGLVVNQLTGTVSGRAFNQSLINTVTPLIIALGN